MRCKQTVFFILILLCLPSYSYAQPWSGILNPSRAVDWSNAGIPGGIPSGTWTKCGSTIAAYRGTAGTINTALSGCAPNHYVLLAAGTFRLSSEIIISNNNVELRGMGPDQTIIQFTGSSSCNGPYADVCLQGSFNWNGAPQHLTTWTAGYSPGTTQITLGSTSGLSVGQLIILDQADDAPDTGNYFVCSTTACSTEGGSPGRKVSGTNYSQQEYKLVTNISGNRVTISPGIYSPNWRSSQRPSAWWATNILQNSGIQGMTLDYSASNNTSGVMFWNAYKCWMRNVRSIYKTTNGGGGRNHVWFQYSSHDIVRDNYFYGTQDASTLSYGVETWQSGDLLIENNIFQHIVSPLLVGNTEGTVFGYNYAIDDYFANATWNMPGPSFTHDAGTAMNLFEGNQGTGMVEDDIHGTHNMHTYFRNLWIVREPWNTKNQQTVAAELASYDRYMNVIGNVMGQAGYSDTYQVVAPATSHCNTSIYVIGAQNVCGAAVDTTNVLKTLMRWGNYDTVTGAVRWCGNSSDPGWSTICASMSEVPSGIGLYANAVPSNTALPPSFYYASQPKSWWRTPWGTPAYPPNGPDVSGGNIANFGGHANNIPAQLCFANSKIDSAYQVTYTVSAGKWSGGTATLKIGSNPFTLGSIITVTGVNPSGYNGTFVVTAVAQNTVSYVVSNPGSYVSGGMIVFPNIHLFNANSCYFQAPGHRPAPPTNLTTVPK